MDSPPSAVQHNSDGRLSPTLFIVSITSSKGITALKPERDMFAQERALLAAITFLPRQGTSTLFATGSQIKPSIFCNAIDAADVACSAVPFIIVISAAADIPDAEPPSAWHPPTSAAKVE